MFCCAVWTSTTCLLLSVSQTLSRKGGCKHVNTPAHMATTSTQQKAFCIRGREQRDVETGRRRKEKKRSIPNRERREAARNTEREETESMCSETCSSMLTACDSVQVWEQDTAGESVCVIVIVILMDVCVCVCVSASASLSLHVWAELLDHKLVFFFFAESLRLWMKPGHHVTFDSGNSNQTDRPRCRIGEEDLPGPFCLILAGTVVLAGRLQQGRIGFHVWCCLLVTPPPPPPLVQEEILCATWRPARWLGGKDRMHQLKAMMRIRWWDTVEHKRGRK